MTYRYYYRTIFLLAIALLQLAITIILGENNYAFMKNETTWFEN